MPDGRRPGLWKTLVAAAQTAFDRVADGLELAAEGLRSLGSERAPVLPKDPRLAGVDPGIAAYVAAQDPEWFSFDLTGDAPEPGWPGGDGALPPWPTAEATAATRAPQTQESPAAGRGSSAASEPPRRRRRPARGKPTAAELPAGRPARPSRISFRRRSRHVSDREASEDGRRGVDAASATPSESNPKPPRAADPKGPRTPTVAGLAESGATADVGSRAAKTGQEHFDDRRTSGAKQDVQAARPDHAGLTPPSPVPSLVPSPDSSPPRIAVASRPVRDSPLAATTPAPQVAATARQHTHEPSWPAQPRPAASVAPSRDRIEQAPRSRTPGPASIAPAVRISRGDLTRPAPWPELPPSTWSAPPMDSGGTLAWEGASPADVLIDEQRST
ncbi:hypothetical protein [Microbacterium pumilum]|uniref:Uncharacterized protein n=1 Tax=Microbacterium pumilum TaxID=344165 RepID=A0ABN2RU95_9MICO